MFLNWISRKKMSRFELDFNILLWCLGLNGFIQEPDKLIDSIWDMIEHLENEFKCEGLWLLIFNFPMRRKSKFVLNEMNF